MKNNFEFLDHSLLFSDAAGSFEEPFKKVKFDDLVKELEFYQNYCISMFEDNLLNIRLNESETRVTSNKVVPINKLKPLALYAHDVVADDPLFGSYTTPGSQAIAFEEFNRNRFEDDYDREEYELYIKSKIRREVEYMKMCRAMVDSDCLKLMPFSYLNRTPEKVPITYDKDAWNNALPDHIMDLFRTNSEVRRVEGGRYVMRDLFPCRDINVSFRGLPNFAMYRQLMAVEYTPTEVEGEYLMRCWIPDEAPSIEGFNHWVNQCVNQAAVTAYDELIQQVKISQSVNGQMITDSSLYSQILGQPTKVDERTISALVDLDLPFIQELDLDSIVKVRSTDGEAFENFRIDLESKLKSLKSVTDQDELRIMSEDISHELSSVHSNNIEMKQASLLRSFKVAAGTTMIGFVAAIPTSGVSLLASLFALGKIASDYNKLKEIETMPSYFLWKSKRQTSKDLKINSRLIEFEPETT